uniref:Zn(2)-C6 fungal-type domain-containing protein n=1 Tax=Capronia epimyces CBS 606.96 TaxID=1182542 RepID=W9YK16_9EURO|nr:uncharacterized protein A1O3_01422 [Capronia epimyces CBS 606.96]EXJ92868.1 hypothetical protein A1O3_01422 [Capronia epimyces CBS 606.96]
MASMSTAQLEPAASGYSKTTRRQYQSCDQCRKSRRACDAGTLRVANFPFSDDEPPTAPASACEACSNCAKSGKKCTFVWLRTLPLHGLPKGIKRKLELTGDAASNLSSETNPRSPQASTSSAESTLAPHVTCNPSVPLEFTHSPYSKLASEKDAHQGRPTSHRPHSASHGALTGPSGVSGEAAGASIPAFSAHSKPGIRWTTPTLTRADTSSSSSSSISTESRTTTFSVQAPRSVASTFSDSSRERESTDTLSPKHARYTAHPEGGREPRPGMRLPSANLSSSSSTVSRRPSISSALPSTGRHPSSTPLSPRQVRFADGAMKSMIATGLLRIYHDSFENSLSCWVTERNCPYETELRDLLATSNPESAADEAAFRLGDNRIFSRVSRLDAAFAPLRRRDLTASENRTASKALNAAIMAFASQWSHNSHNAFWKSKEGRSQIKAWQSQNRAKNKPAVSSRGSADPILSSECERMIQKTLWHEARTAIQASAELDSFKVILAHMIFALTQRPIDESPRPPHSALPNDGTARQPPDTAGASVPYADTDPAMGLGKEEWDPFSASDLETISSPPVYLETAVRNLFSWRRKVERYRRVRLCRSQVGEAPGSLGALTLKDQQTFNILFWLGVMCDTTSSAITKRPLVIPDEDCAMILDKMDMLGNDGQPTNPAMTTTATGRDREGAHVGGPAANMTEQATEQLWGEYLLSFKWAGPRQVQPRWPCTFDEAALVLQEAIPVKVLMFRRVGQLQTLAHRRSPAHLLERCIEEAISVYQHWNATYGQFMLDCVRAHNQLPARVQSWYVILDGHWHYGCLLLADSIAQVDRERQTMGPQRSLRAHCGLMVEMQRENAYAISAIAQASLAEHAPSFPDNPDFSFACNGSAILTEPWTDILVRTMGSACKIFIHWLSVWHDPSHALHDWVVSNTDYDDLYTQADICIQGMALLGRKSDAANYTAEIFWTRLTQVSARRPRSRSGHTIKEEKAQTLAEDLLSGLEPPGAGVDYLSSSNLNPIRC